MKSHPTPYRYAWMMAMLVLATMLVSYWLHAGVQCKAYAQCRFPAKTAGSTVPVQKLSTLQLFIK